MSDTVSLRSPESQRKPSRGDSLIGIELQGYVINRIISSGGMGVVYEARHPLIGHRAAVKVLRPEYSEDPEIIARFLREARAISAIKHRNIVEILNFGVLPGGGQYMMMEYLEGETLSDLIERSAPMQASQVLRIAEEILSGLAAAHQVGVVHRDLKPANIMLCKQSSDELMVKVCDFGLARQFDTTAEPVSSVSLTTDREDTASILAGTPEYISPEQASGHPVDGQADLYSLGVILFEMLCGRLPFDSSSALDLLQLHRTAIPPRIEELVQNTPPDLITFVNLLLSKAPELRPPGAKAARDAVRLLRDISPDASYAAMTGRLLPIYQEHQFADTVMHLGPSPSKPRSTRSPMLRRAVGGGIGLVAASLVALLATAWTSSSGTAAAAPAPSAPVAAAEPALPPAPAGISPAVVKVAMSTKGSLAAVTRPPASNLNVFAPSTPLVILPAPSAAPVAPAPQRRSAVAVRARPVVRAPQPSLKIWPQQRACMADELWRKEKRDEVERREQLALASVDSASPARLAEIKSKARALSQAVRLADGSGCEQVEAQIANWHEGSK